MSYGLRGVLICGNLIISACIIGLVHLASEHPNQSISNTYLPKQAFEEMQAGCSVISAKDSDLAYVKLEV